ncbi:MAG: inositol monophosphatase family protein [Candidatus Thermoplasmatota archaeon]
MDSLSLARSLADAAFDAWTTVEGRADRHTKVGRGAGGDSTSRADTALEKAILAVAADLGISVLSEEAGFIDNDSDLLAVVDPLDGSRNAGRGIPLHCTSIAIGRTTTKGTLAKLDTGVVQNLVTGDLYTAKRGKGAFLNGARVAQKTFDPDEVVVGVIADYASTEIDEAHARREHHIRDLGSAALELCLVGTGAMDAFVVRRPWLRVIDIAAATLFVREAGGMVLDPATGDNLDMPLNLQARSGLLGAHSSAALDAVGGTPKALAARAAGRTKAGKAPAERGLTWAIVGKGSIPHVRKEAQWIVQHLRKRKQTVLLETSLAAGLKKPGLSLNQLDAKADVFVTVGGDGTILMVQAVTDKPVLGVNAGAIGFLCEVEPPQAGSAIDQVIRGEYRVEERDKLSAWLEDRQLPDATNEVTLQTSRIAKLIRFRITVGGEVLDTLRGDGLIVSTATGSTGYAMSVGGPLMHPNVKGTVLAPIAPFRLSARPWVVPSDSAVELTLLERDSANNAEPSARVVVDGQHGVDVSPGQTVRIGPSARKSRFIRLGSGFYERVRTKLTR